MGLPLPTVARWNVPKDSSSRIPADQSSLSVAPVKERQLDRPRCLRLVRPPLSARWTDTGNEIVSIRHRPEHPFREHRLPALVKVPGLPHPRYLTELRAPKDPRPARQMPLSNHLQPTSCHVHPTGHPDSRLEGSHPSDLCRAAASPSGWEPAFHATSLPRRWLAIAGLTSPGWPMGWYPINQPQPTHHPDRDAWCPRQCLRRACRSSGDRVNRPPDTSCRLLVPTPASRRQPAKA